MGRLMAWGWREFQPEEGWLPLFLLMAAVGCVIGAVTAVEWTPEGDIVISTAVFGLLLGVLLAKRPLRPTLAWLLLSSYGITFTTIWLGRLRPPIDLWFAGWQPFSQHIRQNSALFADRVASWFQAVFTGGSSEETIVFAYGLGLLAWLLAAYAGWTTFRQRRPLQGLTAMGLALAANGYFGAAPIFWTALFVGVTVLLTAVVNFTNLEVKWTREQVDYSDQIQWDLLSYAGGAAIILLGMAMLLPAFSITELARTFQQQPAVQQAEETLGRVFAGVAQPRQESALGPGGPGGSGALPRSYLLGDAPELYETVVMTAVVTLADDAPPNTLTGNHWRALSYEVYTGRGWALSEERDAELAAGDPIPLPSIQAQAIVAQKVHWVQDERVIRYTLGLPLTFDQPVITRWRGLTDLVRVQGEGTIYQATSRLPTATADQLRQTAVADSPATILARYTALPPSVPDRVHALAQDVAGTLDNPYDQARALERFLRQYPYSLEVDPPPADADPVDFFLFEQQRGYCDFYASAMVIMARSLGLPARMAVGYLPQPEDAKGVQTIFQINGHSWAEIYFPQYGWVEFEPTAAFTSSHEDEPPPANTDATLESPGGETPAIPPSDPATRRFAWEQWVALLAFLVMPALIWWWRRGQPTQTKPDAVTWAYGRLRHTARQLGHPVRASQTPNEFTAEFLSRLDTLAIHPRVAELVQRVFDPIRRLNNIFVRQEYGGEREVDTLAAHKTARAMWQQMRRPLWLLRLINRLHRLTISREKP